MYQRQMSTQQFVLEIGVSPLKSVLFEEVVPNLDFPH